MSSSVSAILSILFISATLVSSRIHQTSDSIIIEVEPKSGERKERYIDTAGKFFPFFLPAVDDTLLKNVMVKYQSIGVPANTFLVKEQPDQCWMPDGKSGLCGPVRSCHPHDELQEDPLNPESRMLPPRTLCGYVNKNGKQDTGVCCPRATPDLNGWNPWMHHPFFPPIALYNVPAALPAATWPWWVPDVKPTTESPSKTSPWWVPETTTTAAPFSTSSPWWVPDDSTTTSPWWVPETPSTTPSPPSSSSSTTTSRPSTSTTTTTSRPSTSTTTTTSLPSTTSPWWVPEVTSTTTASPSSTTSPWWVPETSSTTKSPPSSTLLVTQSSSTTTTRPSTTSPWWVPEASSTTKSPPSSPSTTTSKPSTTSPWWVAETPSTTARPAVTSTLKSPSGTPSTTASSGGSGFRCGTGPIRVLHTDDTQRIVGGITSVKNAWPFAVSLMAKGRHFCGGSLLDNQHILTAAHCVASLSSNEVAGVEVILGLHTLKPMDAQVVRRKLRRVVRHKGYHAANFFNDIAILKMNSPVKFSSTISPVCLPSDGTRDLYVNKDAVVVGWGALQEDGKLLPISLQEVTVKVQTNAECQKSYQQDAPGGINNDMLCAAYPKKDSCMGDSGGPLVIQTSPGSPWIQVGIVSWGIGCGRAEFPGVYVRTTSFLEWIQKNLEFKK